MGNARTIKGGCMKEAQPINPCATCETEPCINSPYNEDQECWKAPTKYLDPTAPTEKEVSTEDEE